MAAALLAQRLATLSVAMPVRPAMIRETRRTRKSSRSWSARIKFASHRSRVVCPADLPRASLVLATTRENLSTARAPRRQGRLRKRTRAAFVVAQRW